MVKVLPFLILLFSFIHVSGQQSSSKRIVQGIVVDSVSGKPLDFVSVTLTEGKSLNIVRRALTNEQGLFALRSDGRTELTINLSLIGYRSLSIKLPPFSASQKLDLGVIRLCAMATGLMAVGITGRRSILKQDIDRLSYDVQADAEKTVLSALDILRKVPRVTVDGSDAIKLNGSPKFRIFINGRPSALVMRNPADILRSMPADNIQRIEVITSPPAKYDAEGLAGILNIITRKKIDEGYNGTLSVRQNTVNGPNTNINGTIKTGKFAVSGFFGTNNRRKQSAATGYINDIYSPIDVSIHQDGTITQQGYNIYGSVEMSYEVDSLNLITAEFQTNNARTSNTTNQLSSQFGASNLLQQQFRVRNYTKDPELSTDASVNYQKISKHNKGQILTASYKLSMNRNTGDHKVNFYERVNYNNPDFQQVNNAGATEHTAQIDLVLPYKKVVVEAGTKGIFRHNFSDFATSEDMGNGMFQKIDGKADCFDYNQNVYSIYNSYQLNLNKWIIKGGLRWEITADNAAFASSANGLERTYHNIIPSAAIQRVFNEASSFILGYSERIERPSISFLNPFVDRSNPRFVSAGNPDLDPVLARQIELKYTNNAKGSFSLGASYNFSSNSIEEINTVGTDTVTVTSYANVGNNKRLGLNLGLNYPLTKRLDVSLNSEVLHVWLRGTVDNEFYANKGIQWDFFFSGSYKFNKGFSASLDVGYESRYVLLQGKDNRIWQTTASLSKTFFNKRLNLSGFVSNPFSKFRTIDLHVNSASYKQSNYFDIYYRRVGFNISYRFGNQKTKVRENERKITNDDSRATSTK